MYHRTIILGAVCGIILFYMSQTAGLRVKNHDALKINLRNGQTTGRSEHVTFLQPLRSNQQWRNMSIYGAQQPDDCSKQAVLQIDMRENQFSTIFIDLTFDQPRLWTLHIAQNAHAHGFGLDDNQHHVANLGSELQLFNRELRLYTNTKSGYQQMTFGGTNMVQTTGNISQKHASLKIDLSQNAVRWMPLRAGIRQPGKAGTVQSKFLFDFDDEQLPFLYIGLNRVVSLSEKKYGFGLCRATIEFYKNRGKRDHCTNGTQLCHAKARCLTTRNNSYRCVCEDGYVGDGRSCEDEDECAYNNGGCAQVCVNTPGSFYCECKRGFRLENGNDCKDVDECTVQNARCQHTCINTVGSFQCACAAGYILATDGYTCVNGAGGHAPCERLQCSHFCDHRTESCYCPVGYVLKKGTKCMPSCQIANGGCQHVCVEVTKEPTCLCHPGYFLDRDNQSCITSCDMENGRCDQLCQDFPDGPHCSCAPGYRLADDGRTCIDIDECMDVSGCMYECENTPGSFFCTCPTGFMLAPNQKACLDIDECGHAHHSCDHICTNTQGSYMCRCMAGYEPLHNASRCYDVDECSLKNNGGCSHTCENLVGSYSCNCPSRTFLHPNHKDCIQISLCSLTSEDINSAGHFTCMAVPQGTACVLTCKDSPVVQTTAGLEFNFGCGHSMNSNECMAHEGTVAVKFTLLADKCVSLTQSELISHIKDHKAEQGCLGLVTLCHASVRCVANAKAAKLGKPFLITVELSVAAAQSSMDKTGALLVIEAFKRSLMQELLLFQFSTDMYLLQHVSSLVYACTDATNEEIVYQAHPCSVDCASGFYYNLTFETCLQCPRGTFQPLDRQIDCLPCPSSWSTSAGGTTALTDCANACQPGSYSATGFEPCEPCPVNTFQSEKGRTICFQCGANLHTALPGSVTFTDCTVKEFCPQGYFYETNAGTCKPCPIGTYQPAVGQNHCVHCPVDTITDHIASRSIDQCKGLHCRQFGKQRGYLESPNYPGNYPANAECIWHIRSESSNKRILVVIPELRLASDHCGDYLVMRRNSSPYSATSFEACETRVGPMAFVVRFNRLWVQFKSDAANESQGFRVHYVTFQEMYLPLIEDIVRDSELYSLKNNREILQNPRLLDALLEVIAEPSLYYKYANVSESIFSQSFINLLTPKVQRFYNLWPSQT